MKKNNLFILLMLSFIFAACKDDSIDPDNPGSENPPAPGTYVWETLKIGDGGWIVGLNIHPTERNLLYVRTDVSGAYRWDSNAATWIQLVTSKNIPAKYVMYANYDGVHSLVGAPGNPDIAYMAFRNQIFKSTDKGNNWIETNFDKQHIVMEANGAGRQEGERLAVDPNNADVVYYGSINNGLWVTYDAGDNWAKINAIPDGTKAHGVNTIVFDKQSGTDNGRTKTIYVTSDNTGIFKSQDTGKTWVNISNAGLGDRFYRDAEIGPDRMYYVATAIEAGGQGTVWKYSSDGVWTNITPQGASLNYVDIAVDPTNGKRLLVTRTGGNSYLSMDQGITWTVKTFKRVSKSIEWLEQQTDTWLSIGELQFDPFESGKVWFAEGFSVWHTKNLSATPITWTEEGAGIEETCGNAVICPPGGKPITAMWDLGVFYHQDPDRYNAIRSQSYFMSGWHLDWCPADPNFVVAVLTNHHDGKTVSGYSTDGGKNWTQFISLPAVLTYGCIAVSANNKNNIVWLPTNGQLPYYTSTRGSNWVQSIFAGATNSNYTSYTSPRKPLCADRVEKNTFYYFHTAIGVFRSTDGGANWSKVSENPIPNRWNIMLKSVPGQAQHLWLAEGKQNNTVGGLWQSTDGGVTWKQALGLDEAYSFGFGKAETTDGYPAIYVAGVANGQYGIYRSIDEGKTWKYLIDYPLGIFDYVDDIDGDKDEFGKVYICFSASGFAYGKQY